METISGRVREQCSSLTKSGTRCMHNAVVHGLCLNHYTQQLKTQSFYKRKNSRR